MFSFVVALVVPLPQEHSGPVGQLSSHEVCRRADGSALRDGDYFSDSPVRYHLINGQTALEVNGTYEKVEIPGVLSLKAFYSATEGLSGCVDLPVLSVRANGFQGYNEITDVVVPEGYLRLEDDCFQGCAELTTVRLPSTLQYIGFRAFYRSMKITTVWIAGNITELIGQFAFQSCGVLRNIYYCGDRNPGYNSTTWHATNYGIFGNDGGTAAPPADMRVHVPNYYVGDTFGERTCVSKTSDAVFFNSVTDGSLTYSFDSSKMTITGTGTVTRASVVSACTGLCPRCNGIEKIIDVSMDSRISVIGADAFSELVNVVSIELPNSLTTISDNAFLSCSSWSLSGNLALPNLVESIGDHAFSSCSGLTGDLMLGDHVTSIGERAFEGCGFKNVSLSSELTSEFGESSFADCSSLEFAQIAKINCPIPHGLFSQCSNLIEVRYCDDHDPTYTSVSGKPTPFDGCRSSLKVLVPLTYDEDVFGGHDVEKRLGEGCVLATERFTQSSKFRPTVAFSETGGFSQSESFTAKETSYIEDAASVHVLTSCVSSQHKVVTSIQESSLIHESSHIPVGFSSTASRPESRPGTKSAEASDSPSAEAVVPQTPGKQTTTEKVDQRTEKIPQSSSNHEPGSGSESGEGSSKVGMIVGVVIGVLALIAIVIILVWLLVIRRRRDPIRHIIGSDNSDTSRAEMDTETHMDTIEEDETTVFGNDISIVQEHLFESEVINEDAIRDTEFSSSFEENYRDVMAF